MALPLPRFTRPGNTKRETFGRPGFNSAVVKDLGLRLVRQGKAPRALGSAERLFEWHRFPYYSYCQTHSSASHFSEQYTFHMPREDSPRVLSF